MNQISGLTNFIKEPSKWISGGERIGLLSHQAAIDERFHNILDVLKSGGINPVALFGPEHGFSTGAQDMISVSDESGNEATPVFSLYGNTIESLEPTDTALDLVDLVICDLRDVGSRYYTYIWTALIAATKVLRLKKRFIVLDYPAVLDGITLEGTPQKTGFESFVGFKPVPVRHGMTLGEILNMFLPEDLKSGFTVVPCTGWKRTMLLSQTSFPFNWPSPNMPSFNTALVYPGMCLIEATTLSEGRGTTRPFEVIGAECLDATAIIKELHFLEGVTLREVGFTPAFHKYSGRFCNGIMLHVTDPVRFKPFHTGLAIIAAIKKVNPEIFEWRRKPYEFVMDIPAIDLLTGSDEFRKAVDSNIHPVDAWGMLTDIPDDFIEKRKEFLIY
ncbi:DUF1343 domain-containing protein [Myxococcota bacterium]|nr:DUF1343 domain-containing protein [Myxococcota bacterium]MBU1381344.1 DUF1343 domain-containing protein [Myxococcota bacterium]MBU1495982.1 DUF1343 domain-containing protein [Myxococcota bacterium]